MIVVEDDRVASVDRRGGDGGREGEELLAPEQVGSLGTALMLWVKIPMLWFLGHEAMAAYRDYIRRLKAGEMGPGHRVETLAELMRGDAGGPDRS